MICPSNQNKMNATFINSICIVIFIAFKQILYYSLAGDAYWDRNRGRGSTTLSDTSIIIITAASVTIAVLIIILIVLLVYRCKCRKKQRGLFEGLKRVLLALKEFLLALFEVANIITNVRSKN